MYAIRSYYVALAFDLELLISLLTVGTVIKPITASNTNTPNNSTNVNAFFSFILSP